MAARTCSPAWLSIAVAVSAALIVGSPYIGELRAVVRAAAGANFNLLMAVVVAAGFALALVLAVVRIRDRRAPRYAALGIGVLLAAGYMTAMRTGDAEVNAVERFHFIEYGLLTALFYRAWRPSADGSLLILPVLAAMLVGTLDEWLQWFIPARVGETRDVLLNGFAIATGLLFCLAFDPPARVTRALMPVSRRHLAILLAIFIVVFGGFVHSVHLGYEVKDADAGVFRSRYAPAELASISEERARAWKTAPPLEWSRLSREDQYFSEAVLHVRRRNQTWAAGNTLSSRHENLILEKYYAPVLDTPSYLSASGLRWPAAQRADAESRIGPGFMIYVSDALDYPVLIWPKWLFWTITITLALLALRGARKAG